jgi:hypothetical protein
MVMILFFLWFILLKSLLLILFFAIFNYNLIFVRICIFFLRLILSIKVLLRILRLWNFLWWNVLCFLLLDRLCGSLIIFISSLTTFNSTDYGIGLLFKFLIYLFIYLRGLYLVWFCSFERFNWSPYTIITNDDLLFAWKFDLLIFFFQIITFCFII